MIVYLSLFLTSFGAATILPFSSEIAFTSVLLSGYDPVTTIIVASLGNCLGVTLNYFLGYYGVNKLLKKFGYKDKTHNWIAGKMEKYNNWIYLLGWTPVLGDPITIYAGLAKLRFSLFALFIFSGRIIRYIVIWKLLD